MYENIKFKYPYFCLYKGNYYYIDHEYDCLLIKNDAGSVLFTYPINYNLTSAPLKLVFNGIYFFSLHKEHNRILIRKWFLSKKILDLVETLDYSSIGILASKTRIFDKYFNMPITYNDWVETGNVANTSLQIANNELLVNSYGSNNGSWHGPKLKKKFSEIDDFVFTTKIGLFGTNSNNQRVYLYFLDNTGFNTYIIIFNWQTCWIYIDNVFKYSTNTNYLNNGNYVNIVFKKYNNNIELIIDGYTLYFGASSTKKLASFYAWMCTYRTYFIGNIYKIRNFNLKSYVNNHNIDTKTLALDTYTTVLSKDLLQNSTYLDLVGDTSKITPGIVLGLNFTEADNFEEVTITGALGNNRYGLSYPTKYLHSVGEEANYSTSFYIFNEYTGTTLKGAIYKFSYRDYQLLDVYSDVLYQDKQASCLVRYKDKYLLGFVNITNFIMLDVNDNMSFFNTMSMENISSDDTTILTVYDIQEAFGSLYRLQKKANYYDRDYTWSTYNYQLTPVRSFVDSTTISVYPKILSADGRSRIKVFAVVKDQYAEPSVGVRVNYYEDDSKGYMSLLDRYTGVFGTSYNYYVSGIIPRAVLLEIEALQGK